MRNQFATMVALAVILLTSLAMPALARKAGADETVKVSGYTKKDGTVVKGYDRKKKGADSDTQTVSGYTKKDGTKVAGYSRKKSTK